MWTYLIPVHLIRINCLHVSVIVKFSANEKLPAVKSSGLEVKTELTKICFLTLIISIHGVSV